MNPHRSLFLRRLLFIMAVLVTLVILAWTEEEWRAARAWVACQGELAARGERLDRSVCEPAFIPVARNLALTPLLADLWRYTADERTGVAVFPRERDAIIKAPLLRTMPRFDEHTRASTPVVPDVYQGQPTDLLAWQRFYRQHAQEVGLPAINGEKLPLPAEDLLHALEHFRPVLTEVEHAATVMPDGILCTPADPGDNGLVALGPSGERIIQTLSLRASARLVSGHASEACRDIETILWLRDALTGEPAEIFPNTFRLLFTQRALQPVWEGLSERAWQAEELAWLQHRLQNIQALADFQRCLRGERVFNLGLIDDYLRGRYTSQEFIGSYGDWTQRASTWLTVHGPDAWVVQNKIGLCWFYQDYLLPVIDVASHRVRLDRQAAAARASQKIARQPVRPTQYLLAVTLPMVIGIFDGVANLQAALDEAVTACALERWARAHDGRYPATLGELVPQYLDRVPNGVVDGLPLAYHQTPDGRYQLATGMTGDLREDHKKAAVEGGHLVWKYAAEKPF